MRGLSRFMYAQCKKMSSETLKQEIEMNTNEVKIGSVAEVKVGRNAIPALVLEILPDGFKVKSTATNREFKVRMVERVITPLEIQATPNTAQASGPETETMDTAAKPEKKRSLLEAAIEVLKTSGKPMNTRELVEAATEAGLWTPTACKTPEQTLYGSIFREIATKEHPRVRKSAEKGKFEFAG